jgi:drug/metabolite transporter (DMT)-like permease
MSAIGLLIVSALLWSTGGVLIKSVDRTPLGIAGGRSLVAAILLLLVRRKIRWRVSKEACGGAVAYAGTVILFVLANRTTTAANAILLQFTAPVYVAIFGPWYLGERATRLDIVSVVLALAGMVLFFLDNFQLNHFLGNSLAIGSGVAFAWLVLFLRKQKDASPIDSIVVGNALAALVCLPFSGGSYPDTRSLLLLVCLGAFQLALPYFLYSKAIRHVSALEAITVTFVEPILNPVWALLLIGERPSTWALVGGFTIFMAVVLRAILPVYARATKR